MEKEIIIPEGYEAKIEGNRVILVPKETEDERIRKALIWHLKACEDFVSNGITKEDCLAYLEKQKEQNLIPSNSMGLEEKPVGLDDAELGLDRALQIVKDARGSLPGYMTDDGVYECDHAIRTLEHILKNGIEQKPAEWSEEDKKMLESVIDTVQDVILDCDCDDVGIKARFYHEEQRDWLKSLPLRNRIIWKPSKLQMGALLTAIGDEKQSGSDVAKTLRELYYDLKKIEEITNK